MGKEVFCATANGRTYNQLRNSPCQNPDSKMNKSGMPFINSSETGHMLYKGGKHQLSPSGQSKLSTRY